MSHLLPDTCSSCQHRPVMEITSWRATDDLGCSNTRMVCSAHLAAALEGVSTALLEGRISGLSVMTAPLPPFEHLTAVTARPRAGAR